MSLPSAGHQHLGSLVAALVDGQLDHVARERALAHLTGCTGCRDEAEAQRRLKARLARLAAPELSADLATRLRDLGRLHADGAPTDGPFLPDAPAAGVRSELLVPVAPDLTAVPAGVLLTVPRPGARVVRAAGPAGAGRRRGGPLRRPRRPLRRRLAGSASLLLLGVGGVLIAGGGGTGASGPAVVPPVASFVHQHEGTLVGTPLSDPALTAVTISFPR